MKKSVFYVFAILLAFSSCSKADEFNDSLFEEYFGDWGCQDVSDSETYHLLEALIDNMDENQGYLFLFPSSYNNYPSVTKFNEYMWDNKEAATFFERDDCVSVLISTYLNSLKMNRYKAVDDGWLLENQWLFLFDYVLTSEICMSKMNVKEKVQLMVLVLERVKYEFINLTDLTIMISIMLSSTYAPFVNDVKPMLREAAMGTVYWLQTDDGRSLTVNQFTDLITGYARQFINDKK